MDIAIVGGGIVGLAHAWTAAEQGHRVRLFERGSYSSGASIRNFGMVWPMGQPFGELHCVAMESRRRWIRLKQEAGLWLDECGSTHLAHHTDEFQVLSEFHELARQNGLETRLLSAAEVANYTPAANPADLKGGLFSPTELCVNPRKAIRLLADYLSARHQVEIHFGTAIKHVETGSLESSDGRSWAADRIVICSGADFESLLPSAFEDSGLKRCKLQMMKTAPTSGDWRLKTHIASGLTLRHYRSFEACSGLAALKQRVAVETPELDRYGIHVMVAQNDQQELILGDSHEYDQEIEPFDKREIDDLILRELRKIVDLPTWEITEHWHGIYSKHTTEAWYENETLPEVFVFTGISGAGMTLSFGAAQKFWGVEIEGIASSQSAPESV